MAMVGTPSYLVEGSERKSAVSSVLHWNGGCDEDAAILGEEIASNSQPAEKST